MCKRKPLQIQETFPPTFSCQGHFTGELRSPIPELAKPLAVTGTIPASPSSLAPQKTPRILWWIEYDRALPKELLCSQQPVICLIKAGSIKAEHLSLHSKEN